MKKTFLLVMCLSLALSACMPAFLQHAVNPTPVVDLQATAAAFGSTMAAQTVAAMPTATVPPSNTPVLVQPSSTSTAVPTETPSASAGSATAPGNATAAPGSLTPGVTAVLVGTGAAGTASQTPTLGVQFFGTLPPLVPSGRLILRNRSHAQAYVSFQCINKEGTLSILEYPVSRWMEIKFPSGKCKYVAWVGGREFSGNFALDTGGQKMVIFFKDRVQIK